jgi:dTDP-4-amino-4,6-dideoxygalactose transaminase
MPVKYDEQHPDDERKKQEALKLISRHTKHKQVRLVQRGNAAIFCALVIAKKTNPRKYILIPDQGGWLSFRTYPQILGFETKTVKTDLGIVDIADLEKKAKDASAFIVTSFAGYSAEQPMKEISAVCRKHNCLLIEDASGALGDETLCDGTVSDIIVGSFGRWKPVNVGYGGFISAAKKEHFEAANEIFSTTNHYPAHDNLISKLKGLPSRLKSMQKLAEEAKKDISSLYPGIKIAHKSLRGLNVIALCAADSDNKNIKAYCDRKGYQYVECPNYTRVEEKGISIELKRIP